MLHGPPTTRRLATTAFKRWLPVLTPVRKSGLLTLAIETSCDDTCVAILEKKSHLDGRPCILPTFAHLHFNDKITAPNTGLGGIHPLGALESHRSNLSKLVSRSLQSLPDAASRQDDVIILQNGNVKQKPDFVTVTRGPGMRTNLACGLDTAKGLATAWQIPLLATHHMQSHALTPRLVHAMTQHIQQDVHDRHKLLPRFPFLTLLVSGGHTMLLHSTTLTNHQILATTTDIAIGDALDKAGRLLLPDSIRLEAKDHAFGKYLSRFAFEAASDFSEYSVPVKRKDEIRKPLNAFGWQIQTPLADTRSLSFSFSGIATAIERIFQERFETSGHVLSHEERLLMARTVLGSAFEHLSSRTIVALEKLQEQGVRIPTLVVSGGVAANDFLRYFLRRMLDIRGFQSVALIFPPVPLCTDNAAMIAWSGMEMYEAGFTSDFSVEPLRKWSMDVESEDGGILGVPGWIEKA